MIHLRTHLHDPRTGLLLHPFDVCWRCDERAGGDALGLCAPCLADPREAG